MERGSGASTEQIREAPQGAIYITPGYSVDYWRRLAADLGRVDLRLKALYSFGEGAEVMAGLKRSSIVIDHAAQDQLDAGERSDVRDRLAAMRG